MKLQWLFAASVTLFLACAVSYAGTLFDDFTSGELEECWEISHTPQAKYEIEDGELILTTEGTEGNIYLWYKEAIPEGEPITIEARINPGTDATTTGDGMVGFLIRKEDAANLPDGTMNAIKEGATYFWVDVSMQEMRIRGELPNSGRKQVVNNGFGEDNFFVFKIVVTEDKYTMWLDDEEIQSGDRVDANYTERVFHITPDGSTDHHGPSTWTVDYVRLTGPTIPDSDYSAVDPSGKATTTWGSLKGSY